MTEPRNVKDRKIYRIAFYNQGNIYELYAREVRQSSMYAFVEVEDLIFGERTSVVVDPSEEKLKAEFEGVQRTYIPLQAVIRIDEVTREGAKGSRRLDPLLAQYIEPGEEVAPGLLERSAPRGRFPPSP